MPCATLAPAHPDCWPTIWLRSYIVKIVARAKNGIAGGDPPSNANYHRVRVRNDRVAFNDAANPSQICPLP